MTQILTPRKALRDTSSMQQEWLVGVWISASEDEMGKRRGLQVTIYC
jgi:hypothetical protein